MTEPLNPFQPPKSDIEPAPTDARVRMFSPNQALGGSFLGGPLAAAIFIRANYLALGKPRQARRMLIGGIAVTLLLLLALPFLPTRLPNQMLPLAYSFTARFWVERMQMSKSQIQSSPTFAFQTNGRVVLIGFLCFVVFVAIATATVLTLGPRLVEG